MHFAIALSFNDPREWPELARAAETAGFGGLVVSDHLVYPRELRTPYPYTRSGKPRWTSSTPWPDPLIATTAMATVTERIRFLTSVYVLPLRHPVMAAKLVATAATFAPGRVVLGVGAGWMREEFDLLGVAFERRGKRLDESIEVMRKLWRGGMVEHRGEFFSFPAVEMAPVPSEPVPIWGGGTSDVALRRAATRLDGWASEVQKIDELRSLLARLERHREEAGRAARPFGTCVTAVDVHDLDGYREIQRLGVSYLITVPWAVYGRLEADLDFKREAIRRFADEVIAPLGASSASSASFG